MKCLIFTSFIFIFSIREFLSMKLYGDYYIENEGYIPAALTAEPISYEAGLTRWQYNKLIVGKYYVSRKIGPIGLHIALKRQSDGTRINEVKIKNVCKMEYPLEPFTDKFTGILDEGCFLEPGNYTLTNWTLEEHMRPQIKSFWYGKFIANLRFMEDKEVILEQDLILVFKDRDLKKIEEKHFKELQPKEGGKKRKKNKSKGKSDVENPNLSEIGENTSPKIPGEIIPENTRPKFPNPGELNPGDVNAKAKPKFPSTGEAGVNTKVKENMKPKFPSPGEDVKSKVGESMKPKVPNPGEAGDLSPKVPNAKEEAKPQFGAPEVPTVESEMTTKAPKARDNKKRRPKRISPKN